ncbi:hypothetical protein WA026_022902 [Henosepilachna vigintioctopunctata]|uniref:Uncharacterized protein n=1 Tax=Henosepilachna vigintioctopunctata TaxID=420089 RepID=A0AAW1TT27_9CUCU
MIEHYASEYSRKTDRQAGDITSMEQAIEAVKNNEIDACKSDAGFDYLFEHAETTNIVMQQDRISEEDSTAAKKIAGNRKQEYQCSNQRAISSAEGIYVTGQGKRKPRKKPTVLLITSTPNIEEAKAKPAPPPVPKKNTRKVTKASGFTSDSENDLIPSLKPGMITRIVLAFIARSLLQVLTETGLAQMFEL